MRIATSTPTPTQNEEVVVEQLIVGVLLFVPLVALLPTTLAWVALATAMHVAGFLARCVLLWASQSLAVNLPVLLLWRMLQPTSFPGMCQYSVWECPMCGWCAAGRRLHAIALVG